jgi:vacuolar protein sorting-associated protein 26
VDEETRVKRTIKYPGPKGQDITEDVGIYGGKEEVKGSVEIIPPSGKKVEHLGIKIELIGHIELYFDRANTQRIMIQTKELESQGELRGPKTYSFEFGATEKPFETYSGINVRLRYFVRVTISRSYSQNIVKEKDFLVNLIQAPVPTQALSADTPAQPIKMEVGIEDCLHIEFEYDKSKYHLKDVILGKIYFLLVKIKIKHMELVVVRKEAAGSGSNTYNESENVSKYELMDGAPVKGECVPIRLFLGPLDLTPTYRLVNGVFSVKYYLNLVLIDEEDRRYFKQQEVIFYRAE